MLNFFKKLLGIGPVSYHQIGDVRKAVVRNINSKLFAVNPVTQEVYGEIVNAPFVVEGQEIEITTGINNWDGYSFSSFRIRVKNPNDGLFY